MEEEGAVGPGLLESSRREPTTAEAGEKVQTTTLKGSMGERINKALAKVEEKKRKRAMRKAQVRCFESLVRLCWIPVQFASNTKDLHPVVFCAVGRTDARQA